MLPVEQMLFSNFDRSLTTDAAYYACRDFSDAPEQHLLTLVCCSSEAETHLRHAVANAHPAWDTHYLSMDALSEQLDEAVRNDTVDEWRDALYRRDLLILDEFLQIADNVRATNQVCRLLKYRLDLKLPTLIFSSSSLQNAPYLNSRLQQILSRGRVADALYKIVRCKKPYMGDEPFLFISYSHKDITAAKEIILRLQQNGFRVWYDEGIDPGTEWDEMIASQIERCSVMVPLLSANYLRSDNCRDELNFARDINRPRLLVYLDAVRLPAGMAMRLNRLQAIHKYTYDREDHFYEKLLSADLLSACRIPGADAPVPEAAAETPAEEVPVEETPVAEAPVEEAPEEETPAEEAPVKEAPAEEPPAEPAKDMAALLREIEKAMPQSSEAPEPAEPAAEDAPAVEAPAEEASAEPEKDMAALLREIEKAMPQSSEAPEPAEPAAEDTPAEAGPAEDTAPAEAEKDTSALLREIEKALAAGKPDDAGQS